MNAHRTIRFGGIAALALLVMSLVPTTASAQVFSGKFTLPFQAHWNRVVLPAGDYSFSIDTLAPGGQIRIERDGKNVGLVQVATVSDYAQNDMSELVAVTDGMAYRISVLRLNNGYTIRFLTPKEEHQMPARGPVLTYHVQISGGNS